jgi:hypothetical protein
MLACLRRSHDLVHAIPVIGHLTMSDAPASLAPLEAVEVPARSR